MPVLLAISLGAIWSTVHFGPIGKPSQTSIECKALRELIVEEEASGKTSWVEYRKLVDKFLSLQPDSSDRISVIEGMAATVIEVLGHDLTIYSQLNEFPKCVLQSKREQIPGLIEETETAINFLSGTTPIDGTYFDPKMGTWNSTYYEEYLTALDFLKDQKVQELPKQDADV
ncbi:MAG: hypothetical protein RL733_49 [Actinomycetota bacterium]